MAVYIFLYLFVFVFSFCYSFAKDKFAISVFRTLCFLTLAVPAAVRYNIGTDYENYKRIILNGFRNHTYALFEPGWTPLLSFIDRFNLDIQWFFVFASLVTYTCLFCVIERNYFFIAIPIYVCLPYLESYSLVRQAMAATIFLVAVQFCSENKYLKSILAAALAVLFHKSVLLLCLILPLSKLKWKLFSPRGNVFLFGILFILFFVCDITKIVVVNVLSFTPYAGYISSSFFHKTEMGTGLGLMLRIAACFVLLFVCSREMKDNVCKDASSKAVSVHSNLYKTVCLFEFCQVVFYLMSAEIHIFNRLPNLLNPFFPIAVLCMAKSKSKYRKLGILFLYFVFFILFVATLKSSPASAKGGLGITPYQSIFSRW